MIEQFKYLREDLKRWEVRSPKDFFYACFELGILATILYRISRALFLIRISILKLICRIVAFLIDKFLEVFLSISLAAGTDIGPGLYIGHTGVIRIHPDVKAGKNLSIGQLVTIGTKGPGYDQGVPVVGDNVYIGVGAKVLGAIKIGNNVKIGANAVVLSDIPDNCTAVGIPAKVVKRG